MDLPVPCYYSEAAKLLGIKNVQRIYMQDFLKSREEKLLSRDDLLVLAKRLCSNDIELRERIKNLPVWRHGRPHGALCSCGALTTLTDLDRGIPRWLAEREGYRCCASCGNRFQAKVEDLVVPSSAQRKGKKS